MQFVSLGVLKICVTVLTLLYASYLDVRYREVDDKVWLIYGSIGGSLSLFEYTIFPPQHLILLLLSIIIGLILGFIIFYGLRFGGADSKALWAITITHPIWPNDIKMPLIDGMLISPIPVLSIFTNAVLLSISSILYNFVFNVTRIIKGNKLFEGYEGGILRKILLLIVARKVKREEILKDPYYFSLEELDKEGKIKIVFWSSKRDAREIDFNDISQRVPTYHLKDTYWAEKLQPFLLYITIGYFIALIIGDIIMNFSKFLLIFIK